ncbi:hypothetical protein MXB_1131 [Myxobolus squamalis]|nr:hypothetical protein MXB_1131 [Myxobolus squamalis]
MYNGDFEKKNFVPNTPVEEKAILMHQFKLRELICNKNLVSESDEGYVHASLIRFFTLCNLRGKCCINRLIDVESIFDYIPKDDTFFYLACLEDQPKHLTIEGEVSITRSERLARCAPVEDFVAPSPAEAAEYAKQEVDTLIWDGPACSLNLDDISTYLAMVRSIGLYGRALDQTRRVNDSSIQSNLAYAFRDSTKYLAYSLLHNSKYNWQAAVVNLFVEHSPIVCTDQLELWTEEDILYFYEEIKKVKRFSDICRKNGTWKSVKEMIEFYYMNKVTESYLATKKERLSKKLGGITQIFIPHSDLPFNVSSSLAKFPADCSGCEGCKTKESTNWYSWNSKRNYLCLKCWVYWKKYGGLTYSHVADGIKIFDTGYACPVCCISFTNKRRFNRHSSTHFSHSCDYEGCNQKFSSTDQINLHKKYSHEVILCTPKLFAEKNVIHSIEICSIMKTESLLAFQLKLVFV